MCIDIRAAHEARRQIPCRFGPLSRLTWFSRMPSLALADAHRAAGEDVFIYLFTWESPFLGGILGSAHTLEVPFVFGTVAERAVRPYSGSGPAALALSDSMMRSWVAFATNGDPSCDELGEWPGFEAVKRETMILGEHSGVEVDPRGEERDVWAARESTWRTVSINPEADHS